MTEIVAPAQSLEDRRDAIQAVVAQSAIVLRSVIDKRKSDDALRDMGGMVLLAGELLRASTPSSAIRSTAQLCYRRVAKPIVALLPDPSGTGWSVVAAHGLGRSEARDAPRVSRRRRGSRWIGADPGSSRLVLRRDHRAMPSRCVRSRRCARDRG